MFWYINRPCYLSKEGKYADYARRRTPPVLLLNCYRDSSFSAASIASLPASTVFKTCVIVVAVVWRDSSLRHHLPTHRRCPRLAELQWFRGVPLQCTWQVRSFWQSQSLGTLTTSDGSISTRMRCPPPLLYPLAYS